MAGLHIMHKRACLRDCILIARGRSLSPGAP